MPAQPFLCHFIDRIRPRYDRSPLDLNRFLTENLKILPQEGFSNKKVLLLSRNADYESDFVCARLISKGIDYIRVNIEDIPSKLRIGYNTQCNSEVIEFRIGERKINSSNIALVWFRHFNVDFFTVGQNEVANVFSLQQWKHAFNILLNKVKCKWINSPDAVLKSDRMQQITVAKNFGFIVPSTLITNDPISAHNFYESHNGNVIVKALHHHDIEVNDKVYSMYTHAVKDDDLTKFDDFVFAPCILQENITKQYELRVTVVGSRVFAAKLDSYAPQGIDDIHRTSLYHIPKSIFELHESVRQKCIGFIRSLGLRYGAIDFLVDRNNQLIFLEVNPCGDWYWIESQTGLSITEAMTELIEKMIRTDY